MKPGTFRVTNYAMGREVAAVIVEGYLSDAMARGEKFAPAGLPGTVKGAGRASRVVGIARVK